MKLIFSKSSAMVSIPILFALAMACIDVVILSTLKMKHNGTIKTSWILVLAFLVYGCQALIFYKSLDYANLTNMNILWDVTSDVLVTIVGIYFFKEAVTNQQRFGIALAIISILLLK